MLFHLLESFYISHGLEAISWCSLDQIPPECQSCIFLGTELRPEYFPLQLCSTYTFSPLVSVSSFGLYILSLKLAVSIMLCQVWQPNSPRCGQGQER